LYGAHAKYISNVASGDRVLGLSGYPGRNELGNRRIVLWSDDRGIDIIAQQYYHRRASLDDRSDEFKFLGWE